MSVIYDLHTHTTASDGSLPPEELVARAAAAGVDVLAVTDHDTTDGLTAAATAAAEQGIQLIPGVEISVTWERMTIHILGLLVNAQRDALQTGLRALRVQRDQRAEEIDRRLAKAGIANALAGAQSYAHGPIVSRTHFAHFLVAAGHAKDLADVFRRYLVHNKPGYVPGQWAQLEHAVAWIRDAGGVAVVAHPARYRLTAGKLRRLLGEFIECGGAGLEVVSGSHSNDDCLAMGQMARRCTLLASCGSDYHGPENPWRRLGRLPALPQGCAPIWSSPAWPTGAPA